MGFLDRALAPLVQGFAKRYIAGKTIEDALRRIEELNELGAAATVDILGENTERPEQAESTLEEYSRLVAALRDADLDATVSIKLSALGLTLDAESCYRRVVRLCEEAAASDNYIRIDMEDSSLTQATLDMYERIRGDFENVGPVLQAYLRRTLGDARGLTEHGASVRLCKGVYIEPRSIAWRDREAVRRNFTRVLRELLSGGCYVGIATHDELLVWEALELIAELKLGNDEYEFQMLLGVAEELRTDLIAAGHRMRVYVPYGAQAFAYAVRRVKENPAIAGHVARAVFSRA